MDERTGLRLGPMLRKTTGTAATVWVETHAPAVVTVTAGERRVDTATFTVHGHHYALCEIDGLAPGSATPYTVDVDGARVWPHASSAHPPSTIHTLGEGAPVRLAFGSCRTPTDHSPGAVAKYGPDALRSYAVRLARRRVSEPAGAAASEPSALLLIGDQVYADEIQANMVAYLAEARRRRPADAEAAQPPEDEVVFYDEYAELYRQAWTDPDVRWLLSTVPTLMLFDDHDVRDDWNTSGSWRRDIDATPWWRYRVTAGLASYWVHQHLGNLTADDRAADPLLTEVRRLAAQGVDAGDAVDAMALGAHTDPQSVLWSHEHRFGSARLLMVDSRASRDVEDDARRSILGGPGARWLDERMRGGDGADHLLIATTLPYLLPRSVHHLEGWNEAVAAGAWGERARGPAEKLRREVDLEHWAAFRRSFDAVADAVLKVTGGKRGAPPATVLFLSGDVHFSYLSYARPTRAAGGAMAAPETAIAQLTASPMCNALGGKLRWAAWMSNRKLFTLPSGAMGLLAKVRPSWFKWGIDEGPWFDNVIATLVLEGRAADVQWSYAGRGPATATGTLEDGPRYVLRPQA